MVAVVQLISKLAHLVLHFQGGTDSSLRIVFMIDRTCLSKHCAWAVWNA